ncbi:MAG: TIGR00282 family metallophosphoesterase [Eubacteriales bacterium]|nr:TIGR00282 family metallophosphoesterase [Eubacteriales bacterium]
MLVNIMAVGDVCGTSGLDFLKKHLRALQRMKNISFTVVNGENANVVGVTPAQCDQILSAGADVVTLGNHTWTRWELQPYLDDQVRVLRPLNYAPQCPGRGDVTVETAFGPVRVINLLGRFTLDGNTDNPFPVVDALLADNQVRIVLVDFHAEATSEKRAMGFFLDGRISALWGTHTHVQTSDAQILPHGTGYITDLGMTGPENSVLGIDPQQSVRKFLGDPPRRYEAAKGPCRMECAVFTIDTETGACVKAEAMRIQ